ncbi:MAG TPA: hypothetical protein VEX62_07445 [Candidatus Limnocylindrales bacterium]|nr:hypothetical protein [Candidatus Limnocylindrales bacterium]
MPDEPRGPRDAEPLADVPEPLADDALAALPVRSAGPPADWLEKVRRHAPGLLLGGPPTRSAGPDSYPHGAPTLDFDSGHPGSVEPEIDSWRFANVEPAHLEEQPLRDEEPTPSARPPSDPGEVSPAEPPGVAAPSTQEALAYSGVSDRRTDPVAPVGEPTPPHSQPAPGDVDFAPESAADHTTVVFDANQSFGSRAALSGAGPFNETPSTPERRVEPWPDTSQDGDVNSDGPARRRVPRVVAMSRPIRPAGIEWPSPPRSTSRPTAVTWSPAARLPEPPAVSGGVADGRDPWPTLPSNPLPDVFEVAAALRERDRRARLFREQDGA